MKVEYSLSYSIIIPVKEINSYVHETIDAISKLNYPHYEVIVLTNEFQESPWASNKIRVIETGRVSPARKRDIGALQNDADILVFLDDDSYPSFDLLQIANMHFQNHAIHAIGGPAITPSSNSFWQKVSGAVFLSRLSGGFPKRYISIGNPTYVDDWPSVNLMVRRKCFEAIDGFNNDFWPGEDTFFCRKLVEHTKCGILYVPKLIVWHHRREDCCDISSKLVRTQSTEVSSQSATLKIL